VISVCRCESVFCVLIVPIQMWLEKRPTVLCNVHIAVRLVYCGFLLLLFFSDRIFTVRCYASTVYAMACVCHKLEF